MKLSTGLLKSVLVVIIILIMVMTAISETATDVGTAADNIIDVSNASGVCVDGVCPADVLPLTSFFKKKGIILLGFMAAVALTVVLAVLPRNK